MKLSLFKDTERKLLRLISWVKDQFLKVEQIDTPRLQIGLCHQGQSGAKACCGFVLYVCALLRACIHESVCIFCMTHVEVRGQHVKSFLFFSVGFRD